MIKRKGKFLTFCFSMLPGAGHMFLGFMKQGISLMSAFFGICSLSAYLNMGPLLLILPVLWFYSFFDVINKNSLKDEDFYALTDDYLFNLDFSELKALTQGKFRLVISLGLIFVGISILYKNMLYYLQAMLPYETYNILVRRSNRLPQLILAAVIIWAGIYLIKGKKVALSNEYKSETSTSNLTASTVNRTSSEAADLEDCDNIIRSQDIQAAEQED